MLQPCPVGKAPGRARCRQLPVCRMISGTRRQKQTNGKHKCLIFEAMTPDMASMTDTTVEDLCKKGQLQSRGQPKCPTTLAERCCGVLSALSTLFTGRASRMVMSSTTSSCLLPKGETPPSQKNCFRTELSPLRTAVLEAVIASKVELPIGLSSEIDSWGIIRPSN